MHKRVVIVGSQPMADPPILLMLLFPFEACSRAQGKSKRTGQGESTSLVTAYDHEAMKFKRTP
jgi:hypothetical protein